MRKEIIKRKLSEDFKELPEIIGSNNERTYILSEGTKVTFKEITVDTLFPKRVIKNVNYVNCIPYFTVLLGKWALQV